MLESLLVENGLLELPTEKVLFKFFLGNESLEKVKAINWVKEEWDRLVYLLVWPEDELRALLARRLFLASESRISSLAQISNVEDLDDQVIHLSMGRPRDLILICDRLFSEHCRTWSEEDTEPFFISRQEVEDVLRSFKERQKELSPLSELIAQGEGERLEFKSTLRYNLATDKLDKTLEHEITKTICAFLNTKGGTLLIGVGDEGEAVGLDKDFSVLPARRKNQDGFEQLFSNLVNEKLETLMPHDCDAHFEKYPGKTIYQVVLKASENPVYCLVDNNREFYIRHFNTSRKLDVKDFLEYSSKRFR